MRMNGRTESPERVSGRESDGIQVHSDRERLVCVSRLSRARPRRLLKRDLALRPDASGRGLQTLAEGKLGVKRP